VHPNQCENTWQESRENHVCTPGKRRLVGGEHILDGDVAIPEHISTAKPGDIVAALIDNKSTLKVLVKERGRTFLSAKEP
jgi:hypothetical protein